MATKKQEASGPTPRAKGVILPPWWLERVRDESEAYGVVDLGVALATAIGRSEPWDHSVVSRFLRDEITTAPMAEAFAVLFGLPKPFYEARSMEEAFELQRVAKKYDTPATVSDEQRRRLLAVDQLREAEEEAAIDQTRRLVSEDEGAGRRRRTGRSARRRAPTS